jgi:hypothetical protein
MQSGAFLQLVLTLQAIVSRLGAVCVEVLEALQATSKSIQSILEVLFVCFISVVLFTIIGTMRLLCRHLKPDRLWMWWVVEHPFQQYPWVMSPRVGPTCPQPWHKWCPTIHPPRQWRILCSVRFQVTLFVCYVNSFFSEHSCTAYGNQGC